MELAKQKLLSEKFQSSQFLFFKDVCYILYILRVKIDLSTRVRPRFFDQVGYETMHASCGNRHFFTKSCHCQTYQNYEQPPQTSQNSYL